MKNTSFPAIGTTAHLLVTDPAALAEADTMLRAFLSDLDRACSRFRTDSALSTVNSSGRASDVDPVLFAALRVAVRAAEETGGLVDPTLGRSMIAIGYDRSFADVPPSSATRVRPVRSGAAWREIVLDPATRSVTLPRGVQLDLGATAKAWAADVAATQIAERLGCGVLVNLGGDLAIAGPAPDGGWRVRVTADHAVSTGGQVIALRRGGLATSSTTVRTWRRADQVLHHVLDPATGLPAKRFWHYVSVAAADCVTANTASTAALVLGDRAPDWLAERDLAARLVAPDGTVTAVAGWPAEAMVSTMEVA
ncbi:MAG TPA: FAD:protein FMN transferase [Actinophytocola sp.]|uniref:FAD:protein FMN transferase n=1 Tax=Actinophytocola sp. TaxID=1872138 RepID=UPI002DB8D6A1|nr:FAD:protein FMN transferase [Actinophytocola sp.]HEU5473153.1 FAD:protein FMN transferase [Actinophytocola sp.]